MVIINIAGLGLILLVIWWFWLYKPEGVVVSSKDSITILVKDGVYQPANIKVAAGKSVEITIYRQDDSGCAANIIFPDFDINEELPLRQNKTITLPPIVSGEYSFHCPMMMYKGRLIVE
ncbi:MAG: cupredoxin domain-containing protein [Colwellia sp.]|nr:cupredoxin domain-containing protein [Colwellia sp.]